MLEPLTMETASTKVTLSDCGKALDALHDEIAKLSLDKVALERKISALLTQGRIISELARRLA